MDHTRRVIDKMKKMIEESEAVLSRLTPAEPWERRRCEQCDAEYTAARTTARQSSTLCEECDSYERGYLNALSYAVGVLEAEEQERADDD